MGKKTESTGQSILTELANGEMAYRFHNEEIKERERYSRLVWSCFAERRPHIMFKGIFEQGGLAKMFWRALFGEDKFGKSEGERWSLRLALFLFPTAAEYGNPVRKQ